MILVADSGSTKTHWRSSGYNFSSAGFNPYFWSTDAIARELRSIVNPAKIQDITHVFFYGAGCSTLKNRNIVGLALKQIFRKAKIEVQHDLLGAARALWGNEEGLSLILGTGSNTCFYDGKKITEQRGGNGFILSDEGSGANLGKELLSRYLSDDLPEAIHKKLTQRFKLSSQKIIAGTYKKEHPNKFLSSFVPFIHKYRKDEVISQIIAQSFDQLFVRHITKYKNFRKLHCRCVGSVAYFFRSELIASAKRHQAHIGLIMKEPADALLKYHTDNTSTKKNG